MIRVGWTLEGAAADPGRRTIAGTAVPWDVPGRVSTGETVIFHPGSLDASARPVALRDHDRTRPIGTVVDAVDTGSALDAVVRVSATRDGDDALVLAGDGALPMFSVGAEPTDYRYDADGVLHVHAADWHELSLLTIGAYDGARVATVTATAPGGNVDPNTATLTDDPPEVDDPDAEPVEDDTDETVTPDEVLAPGVPITAGRHVARRPAGMIYAANGWQPARSNPYADTSLTAVSRLIFESKTRGPAQVARRDSALLAQGPIVGGIEAALVDIKLVGGDNVSSAYRPAYQPELVDIVSHGSPLVDVLRQGDLERGDYPTKSFNTWTKSPQVALQAGEKTAINSTPVGIAPATVTVQSWATGNDISQQTLDLGSPSFVEDYIRAAGVDYADTIQTYAATTLLAAAQNVPTVVGDTFVGVVGKLVSGLDPTKVPAGGMFLGVSWDVWAGIIGVKTNDGPAFWNGSVSFGSNLPEAEMGGLSVFYCPGLPARTYLMGIRTAATWYDLPGTPFSLRAVNVGLLGLDIAVYGYGALGVQYPFAFVKTTQPSS